MKVSFDFDGTLARADVQQYARELIQRGVDVWVVTTRYDDNHAHRWHEGNNSDLYEVMEWIGLPKHKVRFTNMEWKHNYLEHTFFVWHLDDNVKELTEALQNNLKIPIVIVESPGWKEACEAILQSETKPK